MAQEEVGFSNEGSKGTGGCSARLRRFGRSVCNTEKGEFFGRTASSWAKISVFYIVFYSCLAGFFAAMLVGFFATLDEKSPTQTNMFSLIKANPGMGFRPMPNIESTLIRVDPDNAKVTQSNVDSIEKILSEYSKPQNGTTVDCRGGGKSSDDKVCLADMSSFMGNCTASNKYGYGSGDPCVLLKMNRVFNWTPQPFTNISAMSDEVKERYEAAKKALKREPTNTHVGITCEGENDADLDNLGEIVFDPPEGFPVSFYPYKNQDGYRSPLVFAQFKNLKKGALIQVWCKLWAANIKHHKNDKAGSTHFEILFDKK